MYAILELQTQNEFDGVPTIGVVKIGPGEAKSLLSHLDNARMIMGLVPDLYHITVWVNRDWMGLWDDVDEPEFDYHGTTLTPNIPTGDPALDYFGKEETLNYLIVDFIVGKQKPEYDEIRFRGCTHSSCSEFTSSAIDREALEWALEEQDV